MAKDQKFRIEIEDDKGLWHDERGADGAPLIFDDEGAARAKLAQLYPARTRAIGRRGVVRRR